MLGGKPELARRAAFDQTKPALEATSKNVEDGDSDSEREGMDWSDTSKISLSGGDGAAEQASDENEDKEGGERSGQPLLMAAPDRAYSRWRG
jgi:hypothetical protein